MNTKKLATVLVTSSLLLGACSSITNQDVGTVAGGVAGGLLGSQFGGGSGKVVAATGGAIVGALLGGKIGHYMDKQDKLEMQHALETTPTGQALNWQNPDNGNQYSVKPTRTYYNNERPCREYVTHAIIAGKTQQIYGKACRQPDGSWQVVS